MSQCYKCMCNNNKYVFRLPRLFKPIKGSYCVPTTEIVIWILDTFDNDFLIENDFTKYLHDSC